jgi:hypothetical protein
LVDKVEKEMRKLHFGDGEGLPVAPLDKEEDGELVQNNRQNNVIEFVNDRVQVVNNNVDDKEAAVIDEEKNIIMYEMFDEEGDLVDGFDADDWFFEGVVNDEDVIVVAAFDDYGELVDDEQAENLSLLLHDEDEDEDEDDDDYSNAVHLIICLPEEMTKQDVAVVSVVACLQSQIPCRIDEV